MPILDMFRRHKTTPNPPPQATTGLGISTVGDRDISGHASVSPGGSYFASAVQASSSSGVSNVDHINLTAMELCALLDGAMSAYAASAIKGFSYTDRDLADTILSKVKILQAAGSFSLEFYTVMPAASVASAPLRIIDQPMRTPCIPIVRFANPEINRTLDFCIKLGLEDAAMIIYGERIKQMKNVYLMNGAFCPTMFNRNISNLLFTAIVAHQNHLFKKLLESLWQESKSDPSNIIRTHIFNVELYKQCINLAIQNNQPNVIVTVFNAMQKSHPADISNPTILDRFETVFVSQAQRSPATADLARVVQESVARLKANPTKPLSVSKIVAGTTREMPSRRM